MVRRDRVEERLRALGINQFEAAKRAGKQQHFVYDLLIGKKRSIKGDGLVRLAQALECSIDYLTGTSDEVGSPPGSYPAGPRSSDLPFRGIVEVDVFRRENTPPAVPPSFLTRLLAPDPRFADRRQSVYQVGDQNLAERGIPRGAFLICVDAPDVNTITSGALVIVERRRVELGDVELSAREIQHFPNRTELRVPSESLGREPIVLREGKPSTPGEQVRIVAQVVSAVIPVA